MIGSNSFYDENLGALMEMIAAGRMTPLIDRMLPGGSRRGPRLIAEREVIGKVVVTP